MIGEKYIGRKEKHIDEKTHGWEKKTLAKNTKFDDWEIWQKIKLRWLKKFTEKSQKNPRCMRTF